jgi:hypothetical protein
VKAGLDCCDHNIGLEETGERRAGCCECLGLKCEQSKGLLLQVRHHRHEAEVIRLHQHGSELHEVGELLVRGLCLCGDGGDEVCVSLGHRSSGLFLEL